MHEGYDFFLNKINGIFESEYREAYKNIKGRNKQKINGYISDIYRKWYSSTLIEGTILSPANIIAKLKSIYAIPADIFDTVYIEKPAVQKSSFVYSRGNYSVYEFPVISDLKLLSEYCSPYLELTQFGDLPREAKDNLQSGMVIRDNYYIDYLLDIAYVLNICEEAPSIYVRAVKQTKYASDFFEQDKSIIFRKIFDATVSICVDFLNSTLPFGEHTKDFVLSILRNPLPTDAIYKKLYSLNGINLDIVWDESIDDSEFPFEIKEYLSLGIYYLGIGLDKYFFTTMGYYLKIIQPLYILPAKIDEDMAILYNAIRDNKEIDAEVYSPCSDYYLTQLGVNLLGKQNCNTKSELTIPDNYNDIKQLVLTLSGSDTGARGGINEYGLNVAVKDDKITVYQLKVTLLTNRRFWITLEVPDNMTLSDLHAQICYALDFDMISDYSFFIDMEESPFKQITPCYNKMRTRKSEQIKLSDLDMDKDSSLKYVTENSTSVFSDIFLDKTIKFEVKLVKIKKDEYNLLFPRIYRKSKLFSEYLEKNDLIY